MPIGTEIPLIICEIAGVLLLLGTMLLVGFRRIYFDDKGAPIEVELRILGKLKTQSPVVALVFVAAALVLVPLTYLKPGLATIKGKVLNTAGKTVEVEILGVPTYQETLNAPGDFEIKVPILKDTSYRAKFIVDRQILGENVINFAHGAATLADYEYQQLPGQAANPQQIVPQKGVPDEVIQKLGIQ